MSASERRYRRWLQLYPKEYRDARGEEILATLLDTSERGRLSLADLLQITAHGTYVRSCLIVRRLRRGRLPRSVYVATLLMAVLASLNLMTAAFSENGPKNQSSHLDNVIVGLVFIGLDLLLWTWRPRMYSVVMGTLVVLAATSFVTVDLLLDSCAAIPLVLLVIGRKRYVAQVPGAELPQGPRTVA